jgi:hypothetical protein
MQGVAIIIAGNSLGAHKSMRIRKLTPTDPADAIWKDWSPDPVFVRAGYRLGPRREVLTARAMKIISIIWKTPVVAVALLVGVLGASQAGWSGS